MTASSAAAASSSDAGRPDARSRSQTLEQIPDLDRAVPLKDLGKLPKTVDQFRALNSEVGKERPAVQHAKAKSDALRSEEQALREKLVEAASRVQLLEGEQIRIDGDILQLSVRERAMSATFARDRVMIARLLALLERLQHDLPPAMAVKPDDALGAARGAMLVGASIPQVYGAAAALVRRIESLRTTRANLWRRRQDARRTAAQLSVARIRLNQLLAIKTIESRSAESEYGDLRVRLENVAARASDLKSLLDRVSALRSRPVLQQLVVTGQIPSGRDFLRRGAFLKPVVGNVVPDPQNGPQLPGVNFATKPGAQVVSPSDGRVLFSGPYHKYGHVLIVQMALGYDAVLAGLDRVDVRPDDQVLAGEPVGVMPRNEATARLYFELRQHGHGVDPAPFLTLDLRKAKKT